MRLSIVVIALSTLAAAGPLPRSSNTTLGVSVAPSKAANITLGDGSTASLTKLKAAYEKFNGTEPDGTLSPDVVVAITKLKAAYDNINEKRTVGGLIAKRGFWAWLKAAFEAPGLKARSSDSPSMPDNEALDPDAVATVTQLKSAYENLNGKRVVGGLKAKRGFWEWVKQEYWNRRSGE